LKETIGSVDTATTSPFSGSADFQGVPGRVEWAIAWPEVGEGFSTTYCNTVRTPEGGTHEAGFRQAVVKGLRAYGELKNNKKAANLSADDCFVCAASVLSAFVREPQFQGQTKDKLVSVEVTRHVETAIRDRFDHWLADNTKEADFLLDFVVERM